MKTTSFRFDIDDLSTWERYRPSLCKTCRANCCTLPVEVKLPDLVRMGLVSEFETEDPVKKIAKKLSRGGLIQHFHHKNQIFTLTRLANSDCLYLDPDSRRCTIYGQRPDTCRNHPTIGPRPGFCPYSGK